MLNNTATNVSRFSHDCDCCAFIGQDAQADVWVCPAHNELIIRYSSRPDHYTARGLSDFAQMPPRPEWDSAHKLLRERRAQLAALTL